ncbi:MATE family efflux transporter [Porticoccaceae bacterium]|nr:MATE family efflux transporter [Porticoccaceae bacterium]MDG2117022.1 MATE family efflux transporter [Porticoccaceae bacterium]
MISTPKNASTFIEDANHLLRLAGPLMLGQIAVVGMTVTDIYMAGQVSANDLAALQLGGSIWAMISLLVIGIMIGNSPIIGHFWGANQLDKVRFQFQQGLWLSLPMGAAVCGAILLGVALLAQLDISAEVYRIARGYLLPYLITGFMFPAFFSFRATYEGMGDIRPVMVFNCLAFVLNAILDYILVFGHLGFPAMGGIGAAWATTVVMFFLLLAMVLYGVKAKNIKRLKLYQQFSAPNTGAIAGILRLGIPISLTIAAEIGFFAIIPMLIAHLGANVLGAHAITNNLDSLAYMIPLGIGQALTIKVSHAQGRMDPLAARQICVTGFKLVFLLALVLGSIKILLRYDFAAIFSPVAEVQVIAASLFFFSAALGCFDSLQMSCSGALRGYKDARGPLIIQVISFWVIAFPIAYSLALTDFWGEPMGVYGFWAGLVIASSIASLSMLYRWNLVSKAKIAVAA